MSNPRVLILSSVLATSRVGATAGAFCLRRLGVESVVIPSVVLGRHPGWGEPGGGAMPIDHLASMWAAVRAQSLTFDAVLTGYMPTPDHVALAVKIIGQCEAPLIVVDPVMGDVGKHGQGALYIGEDTADAIGGHLLPLASTATPNLWERDWLRAHDHTLPPMVITTSVTSGDAIGAQLDRPGRSLRVAHARYDDIPHGGGDVLAACWTGHRVLGADPETALIRAAGTAFGLLGAAVHADAGELPLARAQHHIVDPPPVTIVRPT